MVLGFLTLWVSCMCHTICHVCQNIVKKTQGVVNRFCETREFHGKSVFQNLKMPYFDKPAVVIDNGSYMFKAGFSCDNQPVCMFRTVVGRPNHLRGSYGREPYDVFVGDTAMSRIEELELCNPIVQGQIVHWDNMERIWHHCFYRELKVAPEDRSVILALNVETPMSEKQKCCEVLFETLNVPALCIQSQSVLSIYGSGYTTGICVDFGYDSVNIMPVYEGGPIKYAHMHTQLSVREIHAHLKRCLIDRNIEVRRPAMLEDVKDYIYVTKNSAMLRSDYKRIYKLPSGEKIDVGQEAFMTGEMIFQPDLVVGKKTPYMGLHDAIFRAAVKCDAELRAMMFEAVVPCGGLATIKGLNDRLSLELERVAMAPVNVVSSMEPYTVAWLGAATFAGMKGTDKLWVSKKQYEDHGAKIVKNKFL